MIIPGYLDGYEPPVQPCPLIDGTAWTRDEVFWPGFLYTVGGSRSAAHAFDVDPGDLDVFVTEFLRRDRWPVFSLPLAGGTSAYVVSRNFEGDEGVDYLLTSPGSEAATTRAALEGHFRGPGLSWAEVVAAAGQPDADRGPAERLLLLLPAVGDADLPGDAVDVVAAAVASVGATGHVQDVASELLTASKRYWDACPWADVDGVSVCLGAHSLRHPGARPMPELRMIAAALRVVS